MNFRNAVIHGGSRFKILHGIAPGAFHDSGERFISSVAVLAEIMQWIQAIEESEFYGSAGAGKLAIGQTIAET